MPLQSGSDAVLTGDAAQSIGAERYLGIIDRVRAAMPGAAITTDIIVGLPGRDRGGLRGHARRCAGGPLRQRLHVQVLAPARHAPAADLPRQVDKDVVQDRYERLIAVVEETALAGTQAMVGLGRRSPRKRWRRTKRRRTGRVSGRARDGRLVHVTVG